MPLCRRCGRGFGERVDSFKALEADGIQPKRRTLGASERDEFLRAAWRLLFAGRVDAERLVFVDEMGTNVSLSTLYAWSRRGRRAFGSVPKNWGKNVTLLASITRRGLGPCLAVEGSTTREVFETYLERVLAPTLEPPGQIVVMDNLSAHKGGKVKEIIEGRGCELIYLPPYSPDLNPIEQAFSKVKGLLRRAEARTRESLIEAISLALTAVSTRDVRACFGHCGYRSMYQPL
jgi:transposase